LNNIDETWVPSQWQKDIFVEGFMREFSSTNTPVVLILRTYSISTRAQELLLTTLIVQQFEKKLMIISDGMVSLYLMEEGKGDQGLKLFQNICHPGNLFLFINLVMHLFYQLMQRGGVYQHMRP
jgi:hypothetical protein